jgi:predicted MFS family arabinose efflux permease
MGEDARLIWTYYAYRTTTTFAFWVPVGTVYLYQRGYGLDTIGLANAGFTLAIVAAEIPAGYVADRFGRRASLALSNGVTAVVMALYAAIDSGAGYVALFTFWGVGYAFQSAIGKAWLYDLLDDRLDASEFAHRSGRGETAELLVGAVASVLAGLLYGIDPAYPFLANAALAALGLPLLASLPSAGSDGSEPIGVREVVAVVHTQLRRPGVRWLVVYAALFNALFSLTRWLEQPALETIGVPAVGFGLLYAGFRLVSASATAATGEIQRRLGVRGFFLLLAPICGLAYGTVAVVPAFAVPVIVLRRVLGRVSAPIRNQYLNDRLDGTGRATVLSGVSLVLHLASGVSNAVAGVVAEAMGPLGVLPAAGAVVSLAALLLWYATSPVRPLPGPATAD